MKKQRRGTNLKIQLSITRSGIATTRYMNSTVRTKREQYSENKKWKNRNFTNGVRFWWWVSISCLLILISRKNYEKGNFLLCLGLCSFGSSEKREKMKEGNIKVSIFYEKIKKDNSFKRESSRHHFWWKYQRGEIFFTIPFKHFNLQ